MKNETLKTIVDRRLSAMDWAGQDAVLRSVHTSGTPRPLRRRLRLGLVMALVILLLLGTALALGLKYSEGYNRRKQADQALMDTYGFTQEAMGMFHVQESSTPEGMQFTYISYMNDDKVGTYTVTLPAKGKARTAWSHAGTDPAMLSGGLDAAIWGAPQLNAYVHVKNAYYQKTSEFDWSNAGSWTLEQRAQVDAVLNDMQAVYGDHIASTHIVPGAEDIPQDKAIRLARAALVTTFGVDEARITALQESISFTRSNEDGTRRYHVRYEACKRAETFPDIAPEIFSVDILSPSGTAESPHWYIRDPAQRTLPDGDLTGYHTAIEQYIESGTFEMLPALDKGRLAERISQAGHHDLLGRVQYVIPGSGVISEAAALEKAAQALEQRHGLTESMHRLFSISTALVRRDAHVVWQVQYKANDVPFWGVHAVPPVGDYTVWLYAATGAVLDTQWSLAGQETRTFTQRTWGQAKAYNAAILPWYMALLDERESIVAKYIQTEGDIYAMSLADNAAYAELFRRNGFSPRQFPDALPGPHDLALEAAQALATEALRSELHLDEATIQALDPIFPSFLLSGDNFLDGPQDPVWAFTFHHTMGIYVVVLKADTGELLIVQYDPAAAGNG